MENNENKPACRCHTVEELASGPKSAIEHDKNLNEYNLVAGKVHYRMYFCFFCGGKLPESKRANLFAEPSQEEEREALEVMSRARSMQEVAQLLGEPDETVKAPDGELQEERQPAYKKHHRYVKRWKTLDLTVREREDGSIDTAFTGKYKGDSQQIKHAAHG